MRISADRKKPLLYGRAWVEYSSDSEICFLFPFNWVARWTRSFWFVLTIPKKSKIEKIELRMIETLKANNEKLIQEEVERRVGEAVELVSKVVGSNV